MTRFLQVWTIITSILCFTPTFSLVFGSSSNNENRLPFCGETSVNRIVVVSTLDGRVTALDANDNGAELWNIHPGEKPLLSSSIHRLELTNFGQLVRMIPSLNGGLYKFNGDSIEPIPLTADHLLHASFRYSDDLVVSGGKESQTIGVSLKTGEVAYECSMWGCSEENSSTVGDVLLVQRVGQVVRAVESRSGAERWNFSVAEHDIRLVSECHFPELSIPRLNLRAVVPDGLLTSLDPDLPSSIKWQHKFTTPIVGVWEVTNGNVYPLNLFSRAGGANSVENLDASIYIGMHEKQLYVQESVRMLQRRRDLSQQFGNNLLASEANTDRLPWKPVVANSKLIGTDEDTEDVDTPSTALSVLYASPYVDGMGFFLFDKKNDESVQCNVTTLGEAEEEDDADTPVTVIVVSLWYWWKEVAIISITTAILFNLLFTRRYLRVRDRILLPIANSQSAKSVTDSGVVVDENRKLSESQPTEYVSRYLTDFDPVVCLGKGGFGVVFEAKNKIDDCHYAIKRIVLPDSPESRDRVMREVRALAKLDHHNIVRYFNSWMESPPPEWQRQHDLTFICDGDSALQGDLCSKTTASCFPVASMTYGRSNTFSAVGKVDPSDSFIVFEDSQKSKESDKATSQPLEYCVRINEDTASSEIESEAEDSSICNSQSKVYLYIQMQLCRRESLKDWLIRHPVRDYSTIMEIFEQIVRAVNYVHCQNLIHRDLKPSNIFFSLDEEIKVGDFGLVTAIADGSGRNNPSPAGIINSHTSQVGTQLYMSPEQLSGKAYSFKVDIFSLGMILFELLIPFSTQMERLSVLQDLKKSKFPKEFPAKYFVEHELLRRVLSHDPEERPTTDDLLKSPPLVPNGQGDGKSWVKRHRRQSSKTSISYELDCTGCESLAPVPTAIANSNY